MRSATTRILSGLALGRCASVSVGWGGALLALTLSGCFAPWFRPRGDNAETRRENIREKLQAEERPRLIAQLGDGMRMLTQSRLENVGLVTGLPGTGGDVQASTPRDKILEVMRREEVDQPNTLLDSPDTAMVVVYTVVPPAARKGMLLDVSVRKSTHATSTNLERGWLMPTSLVELQELGGAVRQSFEIASAEGQVVTKAQIYGGDRPEDKLEGVVIGGSRLAQPRELSISVHSEYADAITMAAIVPAINARFTIFDGRKKVGIATPQKDNYISLAVPPKYEYDPFHFVNVVLQRSFNETDPQRRARLKLLEQQLTEPLAVRNACWQIEALGEDYATLLANNLSHPNPEVRFYNAHSLAYLNDKRAIEPLKNLCRQEPAFRAMCLNGLAVIEGFEATEALEELLHAADAETRYGAVRSLRRRDSNDVRVASQAVGAVGGILEIPSSGPPLVAVSLSERSEVIIFGPNPIMSLPAFHYINPSLIIQPNGLQGATISRIEKGKDDIVVETSNDLRSILSGIAEAKGTYGDWVSFLRVCSQSGYLTEPFAINPIPMAGRAYNRHAEMDSQAAGQAQVAVAAQEVFDDDKASASARTWYNPFSWY